jgi:hypothetical protein
MIETDEIRTLVANAFAGVQLGRGMSLRQAQAVDSSRMKPIPRAEYAALRRGEETEDWTRLPLTELARDCVAHLDAEAFRYYIPAFMLSIIDAYEPGEMRVIGAIGALCPDVKHKGSWSYHMARYKVLTPEQKAAIATFLRVLHSIVDLDHEDKARIERALRNYWHDFLPRRLVGI